MPYQVVWGNCNVFSLSGERQTLRRGDLLPGELDAVQVGQLTTIGAVQYVEGSLAPLQVTVVASLEDTVAVDAQSALTPPASAPLEPVVSGEAVEVPEAPSQSAAKAEWVEFAKSQGVPEDEASAMSKADLVAKFAS